MRSSVGVKRSEGQPTPRFGRRNGRLLGAAAGTVVIVAVAVVWVLTTSGTDPSGDPAMPTATDREADPVALAAAYIEARNAYDSPRARALVSEDFRTSEAPDGFRNLETMELAFAVHDAFGFRYSESTAGWSGPRPSRW